jgi:hypothetical protein
MSDFIKLLVHRGAIVTGTAKKMSWMVDMKKVSRYNKP